MTRRPGLAAAVALVIPALAACSGALAPDGSTPSPGTEAPRASAASVGASPGASERPAVSQGQALAYLRDGELIALDLSSGEEQIVDVEQLSQPLAFTTDGRSLLVLQQSQPGALTSILVRYPLDGGDPTPLLEVFQYSPPAWSPDARAIAFSGDGEAPHGIVVVDLDAGDAAQLTEDGAKGVPAWSPDGQSIAYEAFDPEDQQNDLYVVGVGDGTVRRLTDDESFDVPRGWTDDGRSVLVLSDRGTDLRKGSESVWQVDVESTALTPRPELAGIGPYVLASPNGGWRALISRDGGGEVVIAPAGGDTGESLNRTDASIQVTWSPIEDALIFSDSVNGALDLFRLELPDLERVNLTQTDANESYPVWGPAYHGG